MLKSATIGKAERGKKKWSDGIIGSLVDVGFKTMSMHAVRIL